MMIYLGLNIITLILEIVGVVVAFCSYPDAKHFLKSTMDIYKNEEVLSSCLGTFSVKFYASIRQPHFSEIRDPTKRQLCLLQKKHQAESSEWVEILEDGRWMSNLNETNLLFDVASPIVTVLWDKIQKNEKCCGLQGQDDWLNSHFGKIPATCCNEGKLKLY